MQKLDQGLIGATVGAVIILIIWKAARNLAGNPGSRPAVVAAT
jgi:hypothetical protein